MYQYKTNEKNVKNRLPGRLRCLVKFTCAKKLK